MCKLEVFGRVRIWIIIVEKISVLKLSPKRQTRYFKQLLVLAKLRNLHKDTVKLIEEMPVKLDYPMTEDGFYLEGIKKGKEEVLRDNIQNLLALGTYTCEELAEILKIEVGLVEEVHAKMLDEL